MSKPVEIQKELVGIQKEYINDLQSKLKSSPNVFICYRNMWGAGGAVAQATYYSLLCSRAGYVPFCAPICNYYENYEKKSEEIIKKCNTFVLIITKDFCDGEYQNDDQVRKELQWINEKGQENTKVIPFYVDHTPNADFYKKLKSFIGDDEKNEWLIEAIQKFSNRISFNTGANINNALSEVLGAIKELNRRAPLIEKGLIWVGPRWSDIAEQDLAAKEGEAPLISGAVTLFGGTDQEKNLFAYCDKNSSLRVDHNIEDAKQDEYMFDRISALAQQDPNVKFYFYNQLAYYNIIKDGQHLGDVIGIDRCVGVNEKAILDELNNKISFHNKYGDLAEGKGLLQVKECVYADLKYDYLCELFQEGECKFIVQEAIASGGSGTYILTKKNGDTLIKSLNINNRYLVSVYREDNVPVNIHALIFDDGVIFTPPSIQVMKADYTKLNGEDETRKLMYRGADFVELARVAALPDEPCNKVNNKHVEKFKKLCKELCERIKGKGYRGVLGIDGIIYNDEVRLLEVNCRFQASTSLIDRALADKGAPSLQRINIAACSGASKEGYEKIFEGLKVPYSNYSYNHVGANEHAVHILKKVEEPHSWLVAKELDGLDATKLNGLTKYGNAHLFRLVFNTNICWVNEDGAVNLDECICEPVDELHDKILNNAESKVNEKVDGDDLLALKIALLTQGANRQDGSREVRIATNDAIDICFGEKYYDVVINVPTQNKFQAFSPFDIAATENGEQTLLYYGQEITSVKLYEPDKLAETAIKNTEFHYSDVAFLSTDRLRVHVTNQCIYKKNVEKRESCKFCNICPTTGDIDEGTIAEVIGSHWAQRTSTGLRHFLIGGQSPEQNDATMKKLKDIIGTIKKVTGNNVDAEIYAMILPLEKEKIKELKQAGLDQIAFNIEIFDEVCAKKYMPGKGSIKRETYMKALSDARDIWFSGSSHKEEVVKQVRSMVILGLEPRESFIKGIKTLINIGIQPLISLFRPLKNTELEDYVAPSMGYVYNVYQSVQDEMREYREKRKNRFMMLGPDCKCCQNNTLSLPAEICLK